MRSLRWCRRSPCRKRTSLRHRMWSIQQVSMPPRSLLGKVGHRLRLVPRRRRCLPKLTRLAGMGRRRPLRCRRRRPGRYRHPRRHRRCRRSRSRRRAGRPPRRRIRHCRRLGPRCRLFRRHRSRWSRWGPEAWRRCSRRFRRCRRRHQRCRTIRRRRCQSALLRLPGRHRPSQRYRRCRHPCPRCCSRLYRLCTLQCQPSCMVSLCCRGTPYRYLQTQRRPWSKSRLECGCLRRHTP